MTVRKKTRRGMVLGALLGSAVAFVGARGATAALPEAIDPAAGSAVPAAPVPDSAPSTPSAPPSGGDAEPAPVSSSSGGDAEPAPPSASDPPLSGGFAADSPNRQARHRIAVSPRFAYRLGAAGSTISPAAGYGVGGTFEWTYARPAAEIELALGVDFSSDRFATGERGITTQSGTPAPYDSTRVIIESAFVLTHTVAFPVGPVRPFLTLGAGLGFGDLESVAQAYQPGSLRDAQLLGRVSVGFDVVVSRIWFATLRADYTTVRRVDPLVTTGGLTLPVFGDLIDINLGLAYRF